MPRNTALAVLKVSASLESFIVEETALADLLERAWKPVGRQIRDQLSKAVNFKAGMFTPSAPVDMGLWITPGMYTARAERQWQGIEKRVAYYLEQAYLRAWAEGPEAVRKSEDGEEDRRDAFPEPEAAPQDRRAERLAMLAALASLARTQFVTHAETTAIPAAQAILDTLRRWHGLEDREEASDGETAALAKARSDLIGKLADILEGTGHAGTANLTVARAYNFGFLDWASANAVTQYRICARLDGKLCEACAALDGQVFAVADALNFRRSFLAVLDDPEQLKKTAPFLTKQSAKEPDDTFHFPPFHPRCRCRPRSI